MKNSCVNYWFSWVFDNRSAFGAMSFLLTIRECFFFLWWGVKRLAENPICFWTKQEVVSFNDNDTSKKYCMALYGKLRSVTRDCEWLVMCRAVCVFNRPLHRERCPHRHRSTYRTYKGKLANKLSSKIGQSPATTFSSNATSWTEQRQEGYVYIFDTRNRLTNYPCGTFIILNELYLSILVNEICFIVFTLSPDNTLVRTGY